MSNVVQVRFLLTPRGQRDAYAKGKPAGRESNMLLDVSPTSETSGPLTPGQRALELAFVPSSGVAQLRVGYLNMAGIASRCGPVPTYNDKGEMVGEELLEWDAYPSPGAVVGLAEKYHERQTRHLELREAVALGTAIAKAQCWLLTEDAKVLEESPHCNHSDAFSAVVVAVGHADQLAATDLETALAAAETCAAAWAAERAQALAEVERDAWVAEHGSARLQDCHTEGFECEAIYRDERLAHDHPDWVWLAQCSGAGKDPRNPSSEAFGVLYAARDHKSDAKLRYWEVWRRATGDLKWTGYVAEARFLGRLVIFGLPEEYIDEEDSSC